MKAEDFFIRGLPCETAALGIILPFLDRTFTNILLNDVELISRNFNAKETIRSQFPKFLHLRYGLKRNLATLMLIPRCQDFFTGFQIQHGPNAFLKRTLETVWDAEEETMDKTCRNRFRSEEDVNQYIFKWWQWCSGSFYPAHTSNLFKLFHAESQVDEIGEFIREQKIKIIVINDDHVNSNRVEETRNKIADAFYLIYPEKSSFEK